jgi:hypothetical protein
MARQQPRSSISGRPAKKVRGWARYWAQLHHYIADLAERRRDLRSAIRIVRYEDLCASPHATLRAVLDHCALPVQESFLADAADRFHQPTYYTPRFSAEDLAIIAEETAAAASRFGYHVDPLARAQAKRGITRQRQVTLVT